MVEDDEITIPSDKLVLKEEISPRDLAKLLGRPFKEIETRCLDIGAFGSPHKPLSKRAIIAIGNWYARTIIFEEDIIPEPTLDRSVTAVLRVLKLRKKTVEAKVLSGNVDRVQLLRVYRGKECIQRGVVNVGGGQLNSDLLSINGLKALEVGDIIECYTVRPLRDIWLDFVEYLKFKFNWA